ncbi:MAG: hypothetical protein RL326_765 [Pseudomonadota bacterium]|jgi:hypothetical protein
MDLAAEAKKLSVCLYVEGAKPDRSFHLLDALKSAPGLGFTWELLVGVNTPRYDLREYISAEHRTSRKIVWFESGTARAQAALWRAQMSNSTANWILLVDDRISLDSDWYEKLPLFIDSHRDQDVIALGADPVVGDSDTVAARGFLLKTSWLRRRLRDSDVSAELVVASEHELTRLGLGGFELGHDVSLDTILDETGTVCAEPAPLLSACLCTYGNHPELVLRCVDSILKENISSSELELLIGCNDASRDVMNQLERRALNAPYGLLIRSPHNFNKSGMQRFTFRLSRAAHILSLDDDMYFLPGWFNEMRAFLSAAQAFDVAGRLHTLTNRGWWSGKKRPYDQFVRRKHWWRNKTPHGVEVHFPAGQCFLVRRDFVLRHDYPDCGMRIDWDDVLLGDLVAQMEGRQIAFPDELTKKIIVDEIASRGKHGGG